MPVIQNEPILPMKLASKEAGAGLPPVIPPGQRAVSVRVNEVIGVAGYVTARHARRRRGHGQPDAEPGGHDLEGDSHRRRRAGRRHQDRTRHRKGQAGGRERRDAAGESRRVGAPDAGRATKARFSSPFGTRWTRTSPKTLGIKPAALLGTARRRARCRAHCRRRVRAEKAAPLPRRPNPRPLKSSAATSVRTKSCARSSKPWRTSASS